MRKRTAMTLENGHSEDLSELLQLALANLGYTKERQIHYVFLIEEALTKWRNVFPADVPLRFERRDTALRATIVLSLPGSKCNPFLITHDGSSEELTPERMVDRLLSGVGSELKYGYRRGVNRIEIRLPKADIENSLFRRSLLVLMLPIALQSLLENIASNIDALMLGFLSAADMSAVSLATKYAMIHTFLLAALTTSLANVCSQFWGVRDRKSIAGTASIAMRSAALLSVLFFAVTALFPARIMSVYTDNLEFIAAGTKYLRILSFSFLISPLYRIPYAVMRSTGRVKRSVTYAISGCAANILLNAVLIFGPFGLPAMGINGAALATVLSGVLQIGLVVSDRLRGNGFQIRYFKGAFIRSPLTPTYFSIALPTAAQHLMWIVGINIITAALGHMEADVVAANSALLVVTDMIASIRNGAGAGVGMLMANTLGKGRLDEAKKKSRLIMRMGLAFGLVCMTLVAAASFSLRFLPMDLSPRAIRYMNVLIAVYSINSLFAMLSSMVNQGMLFPGGDSKGVLLMDFISLWCILVPFAVFGSRLPFIPPLAFIGILKFDELISFPFKLFRSKKGYWLKSMVKK